MTPGQNPPRWSAAAPALLGAFDRDALALSRYAAAGAGLLADLPPKPDRSPEQLALAADVHRCCRRARSVFLHEYARPLYNTLTAGRTRRPRLAELAYAAAELVPGLVPTAEQITAERLHIQADKEGWEIDQGILFRALFRVPEVGAHLLDSMLAPTPRAQRLLPAFAAEGLVELGAVRLERHGETAHLTVRNLHCLNAEDDALIEDMETAVDLVLLDEQVSVGVLRGGPMTHPRYLGRRVFSAGVNLIDLYRGQISFVDFMLRREVGYISKLMRGLLVDDDWAAWPRRTLDKPWLAAVDGFAIGGGMQLLLAVDRVVAANDAYLSLPAAQEGIVPGVANLRLSRHTGGRLAREVILGGRKLWASEPAARAVVDEAVDAQRMDEAVRAHAERLAAPAVRANRRMLNLADEPTDRFREYLAEFSVEQALRIYGSDVIEKVRLTADRARRAEAVGSHG